MGELTSKQQKFIEQLVKLDMNVTESCKVIGVNRSTYYRWCNKSDAFREKRDEAEESLYDMVESKIYEQIKQGNTTMLIFFAKTRMKKRGYVEKQEIKNSGSLEIVGDILNRKVPQVTEEMTAEESIQLYQRHISEEKAAH